MNRFNKVTDFHKAAAIHGKMAVVYHGSNDPPDKFIELWKEGNFKPGSGAGQWAGPGLYTVFEKSETLTEKGTYGSYVYKFILNLDNYLVLVDEEIDKVYPELKGLSYKEKILRQFDRFSINNKSAEGMLTLATLNNRVPYFTAWYAARIQDSGLHYGAIYRDESNGKCCLIQIPEKAKLVGYEVGGKEVRFKENELKEINKNYKKLSSRNRSEKDKILEYAEKYPDKAISTIDAIVSDIFERVSDKDISSSLKNKNINTDFYLNARTIAANSLIEESDDSVSTDDIGRMYEQENKNEPELFTGDSDSSIPEANKFDADSEKDINEKLKKLSSYLYDYGLVQEAEKISSLTKIAVLKRLKRTTRGKGKKDRMEWALVSKSNPKKILKWFGPDKPSKKEVAKEERRVHAFG